MELPEWDDIKIGHDWRVKGLCSTSVLSLAQYIQEWLDKNPFTTVLEIKFAKGRDMSEVLIFYTERK